MKKVLLSSVVAVFLAGSTSSACGGMWQIIQQILALQEAIAAIQEAQQSQPETPVTATPTTEEEPAPEPPPPPPPVFVQAAPDSLELWDARETVAIPEQVAPIELEEQVIIS